MIIRDFAPADWMEYPAAEKFKSGSEPMIAKFDCLGIEVTGIADANGINIMAIDADYEDYSVSSELKLSEKVMKGLLIEYMSELETLIDEDCSFEPIKKYLYKNAIL